MALPVVDAFELVRPLGAGGMGLVWRARHRASGAPAAIKILSAERAASAVWRRAFEEEVRAVASLHHPAVVRLFDRGELAAPVPDWRGGEVPAGAPYLAMELVEGGALEPAEVRTWEALGPLVREALRALSHVHAHGLLHRDLKPGNVLLSGVDDPRSPIRLTDFGMAWHRERASGEAPRGGTPGFMAPEQWRGETRSFGPPTDLYGLGALVWALVCGGPPHETSALVSAGGWLPPPELAPRVPVPEGLAGWLACCLARAPADRFPTAADALDALDALGPATTRPRTGGVVSSPEARTLDGGPLGATASPAGAAPVAAPRPCPPEPPVTEPVVPWPLVGLGTRLFGFRTVPLAGRRAERARLWAALRAVAGGGGPKVVRILGEWGIGKTRLARWLGARAEEVGAARLFVVRHQEAAGDGFGELLRQVGGFELWPALVDVAAGRPAGREAEAVLAWLASRAAGRPIVLWIDDAHLAADALAVAAHLARSSLPALVLLTARPSALEGRPEEAARLESLGRLPGAERIDLGPLDPLEMALLARDLLRMEGEATGLLIRHARGSPGFAVALVEDLVRRGALAPGASGFVLSGEVRVPDGLFALWQEALQGLVGDEDLPVLELAATLGQRVETRTWLLALREAGLGADPEPPARLLEARLVRREEDGWSFADPALHATLLRRAEAEGRAQRWHHACAVAVEGTGGPPATLGRHLLAAGEAARAVGPLLQAAQACHGRSEFRQALALHAERERALTLAEVPIFDEAWGQGWVRQMWIHLALGAVERAAELEARIRQREHLPGWTWTSALCRYVAGVGQRKRGELARARVLFEEAQARFREAGDAMHELRAVAAQAQLALQLGDVEGADRTAREAVARFEALGSPPAAHGVLEVAGAARLRTGDLAGAEAAYRAARDLCERSGRRNGVGLALNGLGEVARARGDLEEAARCYRASWEVAHGTGLEWAEAALLNLGLVELARGRTADARAWLNRAVEAARRLGQGRELWLAAAILVACDAEDHDWARFDEHLAEAMPGVATGVLRDPDTIRALEGAAALAEAAGELARAAAARAAARGDLQV